MKWTYPSTAVDCEVAVGDVDGDGIPEVVMADFYASAMRALKGNTGATLWTTYTGSSYPSICPVLSDLNGDGNLEVVGISSTDYVAVFRGNDGIQIWTRSITVSYGAPTAYDVNGDGTVEVVVVSNDGWVYALRGTDGGTVWIRNVGSGDNNSSRPAVGDVNGDGSPEVVVMSANGTVYVFRGSDGSVLWTRNIGSYSAYWFSSSPSIGDVDGDGNLEVVIGGANGLYALRGTDGSVIWNRSGIYWLNHSAIEDVNGDGIPEVIAVTSTSWTDLGTLEVLRGTDGTLLWSRSGNGVGFQATTPKVADLFPSSPGKEIVWGTEYYPDVWIFSSSGSILWSVGSSSGGAHSTVVADVDGDRCAELVVAMFLSGDNEIRVYDDPADTFGCTPLGGNDDLANDERVATNGLTFTVIRGGVLIRGRGTVVLYSADGRKIRTAKVSGEVKVPLTPGIYFVRYGSKTRTVVVP